MKAAGEGGKDKEGRKEGGGNSDGQVPPPPNVDNIPRPLSPTKLTPMGRFTLDRKYQGIQMFLDVVLYLHLNTWRS